MPGPEPNETRVRSLAVAAAASLLVLVAIPFDLVPLLRGPAPYPPEWQWAFRPGGPARPLWGAAACALGLLGLLWASGTGRARGRPAPARRALIAGAVLLGCGLQVGLLAREPGSPLRTLLSRARSRSFTSYHTVAISPEARDPATFLRGHATHLSEWTRSAKHAATHPPGPILYYRAALGLCEASPAMTDGLLRAAGVPDREFRPPATRAARAAALLGALLLVLLGALTAWPVGALARALGAGDLPATRLAILWALVPGPALMTPQFDQALALPVALATLLLLTTASGTWRAVAAGALGGAALLTSYGAAAFLVIGGLAAIATNATDRGALRRAVTAALLATGVAGLVAFGLPALLGHEPLRALLSALSIHREVFTAPRSYALWLLFNPVDLALFLGVPVAVAGLWASVASRREPLSCALARYRWAVFGGLLALLLAGVTRGEVGRLWIPLMPLLLVAILREEDGLDRRDSLVYGVLLAAFTLAMGSYWVV